MTFFYAYNISEEMFKRGPRRVKRSVGGRRRPGAKRAVGQRKKTVGRRVGQPKRQHVQANLGGLSLTRFVASHRPSAVARHIKKVGQPNYINLTYPWFMGSDGGGQVNSSFYLNCRNDLQSIWASIQSLNREFNTTTGVPFIESATGVRPNASFRYVLETAVSILNLANTSGTPINVELYDVVAKRDTGTFSDLSGNVGGGSQTLDPSVAWATGSENQGNMATGFPLTWDTKASSVNPSNLGATPYQSKMFKDFFKVVRKTNVSLPIGGQHRHCVDLKPNFVVDNDILSQNNVYKGMSYFTLIVASGIPVVKCGLGDDTSDVTTSAVSLSVIQNVKYKWSWCEDSRVNIYYANAINTANNNPAQSVQPSMVKVDRADYLGLSKIQPTNNQFVSLPSECTL